MHEQLYVLLLGIVYQSLRDVARIPRVDLPDSRFPTLRARDARRCVFPRMIHEPSKPILGELGDAERFEVPIAACRVPDCADLRLQLRFGGRGEH